PGPVPDDPVRIGVLQLDVLPGLHRLLAERPQLDGHRGAWFQPGPPSRSTGPRLEPHPLAGRVPDRVLQTVPCSVEPHAPVAGATLRPSPAEARRQPGA